MSRRNRLRYSVRPIKKEDRNLLVRLMADIHGAMDAVAWLVPVHLARGNLDAMRPTARTEFD